jgi:hypothetical protein
MPPRRRETTDADVPDEFEDGNGELPDEDVETEDPVNPEPANPAAEPVASPDTEDDDEPDAEVVDPASKRASDDVYVVTTDLVMLKVGKATGQTIRAHRGQLVKITGDHPYIDVDQLIRIKAIAPNDGEPKRRTTAQAMARAAGAIDDPVKLPQSMIVKDTTVVPAGDQTVATD